MKNRDDQMLRGPLLRNILFYAVPVFLTTVLQLLFHAADLVVVGRYCGSISLAAVGATGAVTRLVVNLFMGLSVGAGVAVAHGLGAGEDEAVRRTVHSALPAALVSGGVLTVLGVVFSHRWLILMDTPSEVLPLSVTYMRIYFGGIVFTMVYNFCAAILLAVGDTKSPLLFLFIAGFLNVALNLMFVTVLHMNVAGVALATTLSQGVSAVLAVMALMRREDACRLNLTKLRFYKHELIKMIRIGLPAGIQGSLFSVSNVLIQSSINSFGDALMSGSAASQNIEGFVYAGLSAVHQTATNFVGQNVGARQYKRVLRILWCCLGCALVSGLGVSLLAYSFGPTLLSIYITDSPQALAYGMLRMTYVCLPYFLCGLMDVTTGTLRGMGASTVPMVISVLGVCGIRIGWVATIFQLPGSIRPNAFSAPIW